MKPLFSILLYSLLLCSCGSSSEKAKINPTTTNKDSVALNSQLQDQLKQLQLQQSREISTLNTQIQNQFKQTTSDLQNQIQTVNAQTQKQLTELQKSLQQQIAQLQQQIKGAPR